MWRREPSPDNLPDVPEFLSLDNVDEVQFNTAPAAQVSELDYEEPPSRNLTLVRQRDEDYEADGYAPEELKRRCVPVVVYQGSVQLDDSIAAAIEAGLMGNRRNTLKAQQTLSALFNSGIADLTATAFRLARRLNCTLRVPRDTIIDNVSFGVDGKTAEMALLRERAMAKKLVEETVEQVSIAVDNDGTMTFDNCWFAGLLDDRRLLGTRRVTVQSPGFVAEILPNAVVRFHNCFFSDVADVFTRYMNPLGDGSDELLMSLPCGLVRRRNHEYNAFVDNGSKRYYKLEGERTLLRGSIRPFQVDSERRDPTEFGLWWPQEGWILSDDGNRYVFQMRLIDSVGAWINDGRPDRQRARYLQGALWIRVVVHRDTLGGLTHVTIERPRRGNWIDERLVPVVNPMSQSVQFPQEGCVADSLFEFACHIDRRRQRVEVAMEVAMDERFEWGLHKPCRDRLIAETRTHIHRVLGSRSLEDDFELEALTNILCQRRPFSISLPLPSAYH
jgi:hypothetical protein